MRKFIVALLVVALTMMSTASSALAGCDPGRANNGTNYSAALTGVAPAGKYYALMTATIERDTPYLEQNEFQLQYMELSNGSNAVRFGIKYEDTSMGTWPSLFMSGPFFPTEFRPFPLHSAEVELTIYTWQYGTTRYWEFIQDGATLHTVSLSSGKWTPNAFSERVMISTLGNQVVGRTDNVAYFRGPGLFFTDGSEQLSIAASIVKTSGFPGYTGIGNSGFFTRDNC